MILETFKGSSANLYRVHVITTVQIVKEQLKLHF